MAIEWKKVKFNQIFTEQTRNGLSETSSKENTGLKIINMGEVFGYDFISCKQEMRKLPSNKRVNPAFIVKNNDLLFARRSLVESGAGKVSLIRDTDNENVVFESSIIRVRLDDKKVFPLFYFYWLKSFYGRAAISPLITGINVKGIRASELAEISVPLPPLETQQKIAGILSAYDDLIANNRKQIKLLEEAAQKLYKEWFAKLNFPGHENVKIVDGVPEGWQFERIDSFIELLNGFAFKSDSFDDEGKYGIITIKNVQDGAFDSANVNRVKEVPSKMPDWCNLEIGDILLSLTGNVGRVCLVTSEKCLLNQRVAKLKSDYPSYTYTLFRSKDMFIMMNNLANGAAQQNLSPIRTGEQKILKPTNEIISAFEGLLSPFIKRELSLFIQIQLLQSARDKLLPKLMNGNFY